MKRIIKIPYVCGVCWADVDPDADNCEHCGARFGDETELVSDRTVEVVRKEIDTEQEIAKQKFKYRIEEGNVRTELVQDPSTGKVVGVRPRKIERQHELLPPPPTVPARIICSWCGGWFTFEEMKRHYLKCFEGPERPVRKMKKPR
jgi:DNA-directed RNA polymerase subunit RPC12/RpoP